MKRALHLADHYQQVRERAALADNAIDALSFGMVVVGEDGRVALANQLALELSAGEAGLAIKDNRLAAQNPLAHAALSTAVTAALAQASGRTTRATAAVRIPGSKGRPLTIVVAPLPPRAGNFVRHRPAAIVFITDPNRKTILAADVLRQLYGLTQAEVRVAELVVNGLSLEAAADLLGVTRNTVRNHLQNIYGKTGARRLSDLVAVFTRLSV